MPKDRFRPRTARCRFHIRNVSQRVEALAKYLRGSSPGGMTNVGRPSYWRSTIMKHVNLLLLSLSILYVGSLAQQAPAAAPNTPTTVIKAEAREVLVDTIVTDKHGAYVRDLAAKDFRVWE